MDKLTQTLSQYGLHIDIPLLDGKVHRCKYNGSSDVRGWYSGIQLSNNKLYCHYGSWDEGTHKYHDEFGSELSENDLKLIKLNALCRKKEREQLHKKAEEKASGLIDILQTASDDHPYLIKKQIKNHGILQKKNALIIPLYKKETGTISSYQKIFEDGTKKMLFGGRKKGCCMPITGDTSTAVCICEGWATAASINEATEYQVFATIDIGNMTSIVDMVVEKFLGRKIIICADNDKNKKVNIGVDTAKKIIKKHPFVELRFPDGIDGSDFNDMHCEKGLDAVKACILNEPCIVTVEDLDDDQTDLSLIIPEKILNPGGLISLGMEACKSSFIPDIDQFNFPVILSLIANAIAGKIEFDGGIWPNFYNIKVGGTSTGKTDSDKFWKNIIRNYGVGDFYGPTDFASGPGLFRGLSNQPQCLMSLDEISYLLKRFDRPDPLSQGKIAALLELHTNAGQEIKKPYGDGKNSINIEYPCLNIISNATPTIFDDIRPEDFETGLIQRFDFWYYAGAIPYRKNKMGAENKKAQEFISRLMDLHTYSPRNNSKTNLSGVMGIPVTIYADKQCQKMIYDYSVANIDLANQQTSAGAVGIISRRFHAALKYGMEHLASRIGRNEIHRLYEPITVIDFAWGMLVAELLASWKINTLSKKVSMGDFHRDSKIFIEGIKACLRTDRALTGKSIANRRPRIKAWQPQHFDQVVKALAARKEIKIDNSGRYTQYFLLK